MTAPEPQTQPANPTRKKKILLFTGLLLLIALVWILYWFFVLRFYEYTDDAYSRGNMISINSAVAGSVVAFYADDTDFVQEGQLLVKLDATDYQIKYDKELAILSNVALQVKQLYDHVKANQALVENKRTVMNRARYDFDNRRKLVDSQAISNEDFVHARDSLQVAELDVKNAEVQLQIAEAAAGHTTPEKHPLLEQQKASVRAAYYNLQHCSLYAPASGFVAKRSVDVGQWAAPSTSLMVIVPGDAIWVNANFKETQLSKMRIGQPVSLWFDYYGSRVAFEGKVLGISPGTGSIFSVIPPQNATGNWIKIVQRLPVRISLDPEQMKKYPIRIGLSAEVTVDITNQDLPYLTTAKESKAVATTDVFAIHMQKVDQRMEEIVNTQLQMP